MSDHSVLEADVTLRLVHTADWHLGRTFPSFAEEDAKKLTRARLNVLDEIFGIAERERSHAVLCAGDLFDDLDPGELWWQPLVDKLQSLGWRDRQVFMLPGNHDPLMRGSVWHPDHRFRQALPEFVQVVDRDDFEAPLTDGAVLYARPCRSRSASTDHSMELPQREPGDTRIRVGMVHGTTFDLPSFQTNFPVARDSAEQRGFDYLALGDRHGFRNVASEGKPPMVYAGSPEPTAVDERGAGFCVAVLATADRRVHFDAIPVGHWTWRREVVSSVAELEALRDDPELSNLVLHLKVDGRFRPEQYQHAEHILQQLQGTLSMSGRAGILRLDRERMQVDSGALESQLEGLPEELQVAARILHERESEHGETARRAIVELLRLAREVT